jgi:hypothetical protein
MTRRTLKGRLKLIERSLDILNRKDQLLRRSCAELGEELFNALERCENRLFRDLPHAERLACECDGCTQARLCMESNARQYEELLREEQRLMEVSALVKRPPVAKECH